MLNFSIRKYPAVFTLLSFVAGLVFTSVFRFRFFSESSLYTIFLLTLIVLGTITYLKLQPEFRNPRLFIFYMVIVSLAGIVRYEQKLNASSTVELESILGGEKETDVLLYGSVIEQPELSNDYVRILVASDSVIFQNKAYRVNIKILCRIYRNKYSEQLDKIVLFGDDVSIEGKLQELPHKRNPGEFDYGNYLKIHGINAVFTTYGFDKITIKGNTPSDFYKEKIIYPVKTYCSQVIDRFISGDEGEFLKGIVLGERSGITREAKEDFVNAGVAHIIAVSGLNVAYVLICAGVLLTFVPVKYKYKIFILILLLIFYMNLTGNAPSIVRAVIMASVFLLSKLLERKPNSYSIISFSALIILALDPQQVFDSGFILSFSAVLSIVYFYPKLEKLVLKLKFYKRPEEANFFHKAVKLLTTYLLVTLAAQIGILPIAAIMFEKISLVSLFTNLVVIPLSNIALAIGFLVILTSLVSLWLAGIFASAVSAILYFLLWFINYFAGFDFSFIETYTFDLILFVFYYLLVFTLFGINRFNYKAKIVITILLIADLYMIDSQSNKVQNIRVTYLDVGNSNSSLISVADGQNFLVNAGTSGMNYNSAERSIIPYLKRQRIGKIDMLILTGMDFNEFRNLIYLVINFAVAKIMLPSYYKPLFEDGFVGKVFKKTEVEFVVQQALTELNDTSRFYFNCYGKSMAVVLSYGESKFVFTGLDNELQEQAAGNYAQNGPTVLRLLTGSSFDHYSPSFILKTNPQLIITSSFAKRKIQSEIFETALNNSGFETINVNNEGAVIIKSNGRILQRVNWK